MSDPIVDEYENRCWYNSNGYFHRIDGPAFIGYYGTQEWYINGKLHREDGPAIIETDGWQYWYINGKRHRNNKSYQQAANLTDEDMLMIKIKYGDVE